MYNILSTVSRRFPHGLQNADIGYMTQIILKCIGIFIVAVSSRF